MRRFLRPMVMVAILLVTLMTVPASAQVQPSCPYGSYWPEEAPLAFAAVNVVQKGPLCSADSQELAELIDLNEPYELVARDLENEWFHQQGRTGYQTGISLVSDPGYDIPSAAPYTRLMWGYVNQTDTRFKMLKCAGPGSIHCIYLVVTADVWRAPKMEKVEGRNALTMGFLLNRPHAEFGLPPTPLMDNFLYLPWLFRRR